MAWQQDLLRAMGAKYNWWNGRKLDIGAGALKVIHAGVSDVKVGLKVGPEIITY